MQGFRSSAACKAIVRLLYRTIFAVHDAFPAKRRVGFSPLVPTRSHDHWLRFLGLPTGRTNSADILWTPRARLFGALCHNS